MESESKNPRIGDGAFRKAISFLTSAVGCLLLLVFVFGQLGQFFYIAELIGHFRLQLLIVMLLFAIAFWFLQRKKFAAIFLIAVVWASFGVLTPYIPTSQPVAGQTQLKLMTFNVYHSNDDVKSVVERIESVDPDIVSINEYSNHWTEDLKVLDKRYPYRYEQPRWHGYGIGVFSKLPLKNVETKQLTSTVTDVPALAIEVMVGDAAVRIVCVHVVSPMSFYRWKLRNEQLVELADIAIANSVPTIVIGDFNCTPWSPFLRQFQSRTNLRDSRNGFGYQGSWPTTVWPAAVPIDHAFVSDSIHIHDRDIKAAAGSDHWPMTLTFSVSPSDSPD